MKPITIVAYCTSTSMKIYISKCISKTPSPLMYILYAFVYVCIYFYFFHSIYICMMDIKFKRFRPKLFTDLGSPV